MSPYVAVGGRDCTWLGHEDFNLMLWSWAKQRGKPSWKVVDAKSVFDTLLKQTADSKQDRRKAVDVALPRQSFENKGTTIRWVTHPRMPADIMTRSDVSKGNDALGHVL